MPDRAFGTRPIIKLNGARLPVQVERCVKEVVVDSDLGAPGSCVVTFADPERNILDTVGADFFQSLEISASAVEETSELRLFVGDVYGMEFEADESGVFAVLRAYDASYKLKQQRAITSFNNMTDKQLVTELAQSVSMTLGNVDDTNVTHPYLAQFNETHWDFLAERARANDCVLFVRDGRLHFERSTDASAGPPAGDHASTDPLQLIAGHNLTYLRTRATASQQVAEVEVRGWDPARKEVVQTTATSNSRSAHLPSTPSEVGSANGSQTRVAPFPEVAAEPDCKLLASAVAERVGASFAFAEGEAIGDPRLSAGVAVSIGRSGRFDGQYTLTATRHVFDRRGYRTIFRVSGDHDRTLYGLMGSPERSKADMTGVFPAIVTNVADPEKLGRVKLSFPWMSDDFETDWARVMQIGAGADRGMLWFPEVGDEVLVSFLGGRAATPFVLGGLYNGQDTPPFSGFADPVDGKIDTRCLRSRIGHSLVLHDDPGRESIELHTGDGSVSFVLDQAKGSLVIKSSMNIELEAGLNLTLKAGNDIVIDAGGSADVRAGTTMSVTGGATVDVSAPAIRLN